MKHKRFASPTSVVAAAVFLTGSPALFLPLPVSAKTPPVAPQIRFEQYRLKNGLRVILVPDKSAPVVSVAVTYDVGSRNERVGRTGFAHLFEHMMFQGSENVGKGEHFLLINDNGGSFNGTTSQDRTNYFATVPANQLDMVLFLESDRMRSLDISEANLRNQIAVVQEEKRQRVDNQPYGGVYEALLDAAYTDFGYKHSTIGSLADLDAATLDDVRGFFKTYYAPNNAALVISGDFDPKNIKARVEKFFGALPAQPAPAPVTITEKRDRGERRKALSDPLAPQHQVVHSYVTVPGDHADFYPLSVLSGILGRGRTSRLYPVLTEKKITTSFSASQGETRGPGLFTVSATLAPGQKTEDVEAILDAEIARIQTTGITDKELASALRQAYVSSVARLQGAQNKAVMMSAYAIYYNDPNRINTWLSRMNAVTKGDVQRVAKKYLNKTNRAAIIVEPTGQKASAAGGGANEAGTEKK